MRRLLLAAACLCALGCEPGKPSPDQARRYMDSMTFVRHANGQCFGVIKFVTYYGYEGVSVTAVPSELCR